MMFNQWNINIAHYDFLEPQWFWLLVLIPFIIIWIFYLEGKRTGDWKASTNFKNFPSSQFNFIQALRYVLILLPGLIFSLLIVTLAKPYSWSQSDQKHEENKFGIDIMLAIDVSLSMYATDFKPNRLEAAKEVAIEFINGRKGDKIGLVQYAGEAYTSCPPTLDYSILIDKLNQADGMKMEPGTAIGTGLGTAVVQLRSQKIKSKVIILLTDGSNNAGEISPEEAAMLAKEKNISVYSIGIGSNGLAPTPIMTPSGVIYEDMPVEIDEETLNQIAVITGGRYFRATDVDALRSIYKEIEEMEKRKITHRVVQADPPPTPMAFLNWACVLLIIYILSMRFLFLPAIYD